MTEGLARRAGRAVLWKGLEVAGNRGLSLLRTIILARLLAPDDFGLLAAGLVTLDVSVQLTNFGLREAIVQRREPNRQQYDAVWTLELLRAALVTAVLALAAPLIAEHAFNEPRAANVIRALALAPLLDRLGSIEALTLIRQLRFRPVAGVGLVASLVHAAVAIALASTLGVWAMVVGHLLGVTAQTIGSYVAAPRVPRLSFRWEAARPLLRFGKGVFALQLIQVIGGAVLQVAIARRLGTAELGLYFVAARFAFLPREMFRAIGAQVAFPVHAQLQVDPDRAARAFRAHLLGTWVLLVVPYAIGVALAPGLVAQLIGPGWIDAVSAIRVLAVAAVVGLLTDAATPALLGLGRSGAVALLVGVRSAVITVLVWSLAGALGLAGACLAWAVAEVFAAGFSWRAVRAVLPGAFSGRAAPGLAIMIAAAIGAAVSIGVDGALPGVAGALFAVVLALGGASAVLWWLDRRLGLGIVAEIGRVFPSAET